MTREASPSRSPSERSWRRCSVSASGGTIDSISNDRGISALLAYWPNMTCSVTRVLASTQLPGHAAPVEDEGADDLCRGHDRSQIQPLVGAVRIAPRGAIAAGRGA